MNSEPRDDIYFSVAKRTQASNDRKPRVFTQISKKKALKGKTLKFSELTDRKFTNKPLKKFTRFKTAEDKEAEKLKKLGAKRQARKEARAPINPLPASGAEKDQIEGLKDRAALGLKTMEERKAILDKRKADKEIALELSKKQLEKLNSTSPLAPIKALEADPFFKAMTGADKAEIKKFLRLNYNNTEKNDIVNEYLNASGPIRNTLLRTFLATRRSPPKSGVLEAYIEDGDKLYKTIGMQPAVLNFRIMQEPEAPRARARGKKDATRYEKDDNTLVKKNVDDATGYTSDGEKVVKHKKQSKKKDKIQMARGEAKLKGAEYPEHDDEGQEEVKLKWAEYPEHDDEGQEEAAAMGPYVPRAYIADDEYKIVAEMEASVFIQRYNEAPNKRQFLEGEDSNPYLDALGINKTKKGFKLSGKGQELSNDKLAEYIYESIKNSTMKRLPRKEEREEEAEEEEEEEEKGEAKVSGIIKEIAKMNNSRLASLIKKEGGTPHTGIGAQKKNRELYMTLLKKDDAGVKETRIMLYGDKAPPLSEQKSMFKRLVSSLSPRKKTEGEGLDFARRKKAHLFGGALANHFIQKRADDFINKLKTINMHHPAINHMMQLKRNSQQMYNHMHRENGGSLSSTIINQLDGFVGNMVDKAISSGKSLIQDAKSHPGKYLKMAGDAIENFGGMLSMNPGGSPPPRKNTPSKVGAPHHAAQPAFTLNQIQALLAHFGPNLDGTDNIDFTQWLQEHNIH